MAKAVVFTVTKANKSQEVFSQVFLFLFSFQTKSCSCRCLKGENTYKNTHKANAILACIIGMVASLS